MFHELREGDEIIKGKFVIIKKLGKGQFGIVYEAYKKESKKEHFAIKVMEKEKIDMSNDPDYLYTALKNEIDIMYKMDIETSVKLYEDHEDDHNFYLIMELCDSNLGVEIAKKKYFNEFELYLLMKQMNSVLSKLRDYGIIHRDLKPDNIMLKKDKNIPILGYQIKLGDYGFSKEVGNNLTDTRVGSPLYCAPEVMNNEEYNAKVDLWSIGMIIYQLLFGFPDKVKKNLNALKKFINNIQFPQNTQNKISDTLKDLILKLLVIKNSNRISIDNYFKHEFFSKEHFENLKKEFKMDINIPKEVIKDISLKKITSAEFEEQFKKLILIKEYKGLKIFKGKDIKNNNKILIKEISCSIINESENNKKIMNNEIELLQSLKAKEFPECYGAFQIDKYYYIIIEYFAGNFFKDFINKRQYNISDELINLIDIQLKNIFAELHDKKIKLDNLSIDNFAFSHYQNLENFKIKLFDYGLISIFSKEEQKNEYEKYFNTNIKKFSKQKDLKKENISIKENKQTIDDYGIDTILDNSVKKIEYLINYFENILTNNDYILEKGIYSSCYNEIIILLNFCNLECDSVLNFINGDNYMNGTLELINISNDKLDYSVIDLKTKKNNENLYNKENISFPYYIDKFRIIKNRLQNLIPKIIDEYKFYIFNDSEFSNIKVLEEQNNYIKKYLGKIINKCSHNGNINKLFKISFEHSNLCNDSKGKELDKSKLPLYIFEYIIFLNIFNMNIKNNISNNFFEKSDNIIISTFIAGKLKSSKNNINQDNQSNYNLQKRENENKILKLIRFYDQIIKIIDKKN